MIRRATDLEKVGLALRGLSREDLQIIAERAAELVPRAKLKAPSGTSCGSMPFQRRSRAGRPYSMGRGSSMRRASAVNSPCYFIE